MNSNTIILDIQGFKDLYNNFIVKELAFATRDYTQLFLIKPPYLFKYLTTDEKRQVKWLEKNRGIHWNEGYIDYREFHRIIVPYLENKNILVKGLEKVKWIKNICENCKVSDLGEDQCPSMFELHKKYCDKKTNFNCNVHLNHCALKNVLCVKRHLGYEV